MNIPDWQSIRGSKWFKPALIAAGIIGLIIIALLIIPLVMDINAYRGPITAQLEDRLGRKVQLGKMSLRIFPSVRASVEQSAIGENPAFAQGDFIKAKSFRLQTTLWSLLSGNPKVQGIELIEPEVTLIRDKVGSWNWATLKPLQEPASGKETAPFDLRVENGRFTMIDRTVDPPTESQYTGVNVELDDFSARSKFDFTVAINMPGENAGKLNVVGEAGPINAADTTDTPIDARIIMENVEIAALDRLAGVKSDRSGRLTMDIKARGKLADGLSAEGDIRADQLRLVAGVDPSKDPIQADLKLDLKSIRQAGAKESEYSLKLDRGDLAIGKTKANISGTIDSLMTTPRFNLKIKGDSVPLDSLLESAYAFGFGPPKGTSASGRATFDLAVAGTASAPSLNGQLDLADLKFRIAGLPQAIAVSNVKLNCDPSQIVATPFRTTLGQRTAVEMGALRIAEYSNHPKTHLEIATDNAQIEDLVRIAESFGVRSSVRGSGIASLKAAVDATTSDKTTSYTIKGNGKISSAKLETPVLKRPIEVANADLTFTGAEARADNLTAKLGGSQASGWLQINNFDQPNATFDLKIDQVNVTEMRGLLAAAQPRQADGFSVIPAAYAAEPAQAARRNLTANGKVAVDRVLIDALHLHNLQSAIDYRNQALRLAPLSLNLYGGSYQGTAQVDLKPETPDVALNGRVGGVDLNQFLSALMGSKSVIYGVTSANFNLHGRGADADRFMKSLAGAGNIAILNGKITSFDLMKQVEIFGRFAGLPVGGAGTAFKSLKTNFSANQGRITARNLQIVMDDMTVTGDGNLQLGEVVTTDFDILATLSPALSQRLTGRKDSQTGGIADIIGKATSVAGGFFMDGASVAVPLTMKGPINQPSFALNAAMVQRRATERFLPKSLNKPTENPEEAVKGLIDLFKKKKKP